MEDVPALHAIMSDAQTMRYWSTLPHARVETTSGFLADMIAAPEDESDDYIVEHAGSVIGKLGGWRLPEIGFLFSRNVWGQGFAREALVAFIAHRVKHGSNYLTADVDPRNLRCFGLLTRVGFVESGYRKNTWLVGDEWCDSIYLRLDLRT